MSQLRSDARSRGGPWLLLAAAAVVLLVVVGYLVVSSRSRNQAEATPLGPVTDSPATTRPDPADFRLSRAADPPRTLVEDQQGQLLATFTDGTRTVRLTGPTRTFSDPSFTTATVTTNAWIRLAPQYWHAGAERESWFQGWITSALTSTQPDVLAVAMQYIKGSPNLVDAHGIRYAGDASFGPSAPSNPVGRDENSDFQDFLGVPWRFPDAGLKQPNRSRYGDVDCSGYLRLVYGYRMGYPLRGTSTPGPGLPRRAFAISQFGPGIEVIPNRGVPAQDYDRLQPGDLVFFNTDVVPGTYRTDHSGIFLGVDNLGHYRFISSRSKADGPTFGDLGGSALLDGTGYWAVRFRNARRI